MSICVQNMPDSSLDTCSSCKHFPYVSVLCVPVGTHVVTQWTSAACSQGLRLYIVITDMPMSGREWRAWRISEFVGLRLKLAWLGCRTDDIRQQVWYASWSDRLPLSAASRSFELEWKTTLLHHEYGCKNTILLSNCIPRLPISEANSVNVLEHTFHFLSCLKENNIGKHTS